MNIDELTIGELKQLNAMLGSRESSTNPYRVGKNYFIRTVTHHHTGRLVEVTAQELVLEGAAWIADSGRFQQALEKCEFSEVEMFPKGRVIVGRGAVVDAVEISTLPTSQK
jgi:hypothetical protein